MSEETSQQLLLFWAFVLGAAWGSFLAASIWRTRRGISLSGSSFCPSCGEPVDPLANLPVVSWIALGGRTNCCRARLSPLYNIIEFFSGVIVCLLAAIYWPAALGLLLGGTLLILLVNWLRRKMIPAT